MNVFIYIKQLLFENLKLFETQQVPYPLLLNLQILFIDK